MLPPLRHQRAEAKFNVSTEFPHLGLHSAAVSGDIGLVQYALSHGQPVNSVLDGVLPLHAACAGGNDLVVDLLIKYGADVNASRLPRRYSDRSRESAASCIVGASGASPLHFAAANGHASVVRTLLMHGARACAPDKHGITPEIVARQNGWIECADILARARGDSTPPDKAKAKDKDKDKDKDKNKDEDGGDDGLFQHQHRHYRPQHQQHPHPHPHQQHQNQHQHHRSYSPKERSHSAMEHFESSLFRRKLHFKRSIDHALNAFRSGSGSVSGGSGSGGGGAGTPDVEFSGMKPTLSEHGEMGSAVGLADVGADVVDPAASGRRPSLPFIYDAQPQRYHSPLSLSLSLSSSSSSPNTYRHLRSGGMGDEMVGTNANAGASAGGNGNGNGNMGAASPPRKISSKLSLLNLFKKSNVDVASSSSSSSSSPSPSVGATTRL